MISWQDVGAQGGPPGVGAHLRVPRRPWRCWNRRCASAAGSRGSLQSCRVTPCRVRSHPSPAGQPAHDMGETPSAPLRGSQLPSPVPVLSLW